MICPTPCDPDCGTPCHEAHDVPWKRDHDPAFCPPTPCRVCGKPVLLICRQNEDVCSTNCEDGR